jgi:2-iminobutanoate/2-iminopropanoate deaminase
MTREVYRTTDAPAPVASYSQACARRDVLAVSGQVGVDPSGAVVEGGVVEQTEHALRNVEVVLAAAGATLADVVRMDCYLTSFGDFEGFNEVYARWFPDPDPPARTTVVVGLAPGLLVEITALAVRDD